jgi:hypothetical protein
MKFRIIFIAGLILITGIAVSGAAKAATIGLFLADQRIGGGELADHNRQIQLATPTPQNIDPAELARPVESEAGKDVGIIIAAGVLVLIIVVGVVWGVRHPTQQKAGD